MTRQGRNYPFIPIKIQGDGGAYTKCDGQIGSLSFQKSATYKVDIFFEFLKHKNCNSMIVMTENIEQLKILKKSLNYRRKNWAVTLLLGTISMNM